MALKLIFLYICQQGNRAINPDSGYWDFGFHSDTNVCDQKLHSVIPTHFKLGCGDFTPILRGKGLEKNPG